MRMLSRDDLKIRAEGEHTEELIIRVEGGGMGSQGKIVREYLPVCVYLGPSNVQ